MSKSIIKANLCPVILAIVVASSFTRVATAQFPAAFGGGSTNQNNVVQPGNPSSGSIPGGAPAFGENQVNSPNPPGGMQGGMLPRPPVQIPNQAFDGMQNPANPVAGHWVVVAGDNSNNFQAQLTLNPNGQYQLSINATQNGSAMQMQYSGRWQVQGQLLVFETNGEVEQMPLQFDGQLLILDLASEGVRIGFARNAQASFVQPLPQPVYPTHGGW